VSVPAPRLLTMPGSGMEVICSDIDSSIADTRQRREQCPTVNPVSDWTRYAMLCNADAPIVGTIRALQIFRAAGYGIHLVSNRPEAARKLTERWLHRYHVPYDVLRLRRTADLQGDDLKLSYLAELRHSGFEPVLFIEDWVGTAEAIEAAGVPVLCVNPRYADKTP
jgi:hypothetical protein